MRSMRMSAEGYRNVPAECARCRRLVQAAVIGFSRLRESEDRAIEYAQREVEASSKRRRAYKPSLKRTKGRQRG